MNGYSAIAFATASVVASLAAVGFMVLRLRGPAPLGHTGHLRPPQPDGGPPRGADGGRARTLPGPGSVRAPNSPRRRRRLVPRLDRGREGAPAGCSALSRGEGSDSRVHAPADRSRAGSRLPAAPGASRILLLATLGVSLAGCHTVTASPGDWSAESAIHAVERAEKTKLRGRQIIWEGRAVTPQDIRCDEEGFTDYYPSWIRNIHGFIVSLEGYHFRYVRFADIRRVRMETSEGFLWPFFGLCTLGVFVPIRWVVELEMEDGETLDHVFQWEPPPVLFFAPEMNPIFPFWIYQPCFGRCDVAEAVDFLRQRAKGRVPLGEGQR